MFSQLGGWNVQPGPAIFTPFSRRYASFANGTSDFSKLPTLSPPGERVGREQRALGLIVHDDRLDLRDLLVDDLEPPGKQDRLPTLLDHRVHGCRFGLRIEEVGAKRPQLRRGLPEPFADLELLRVLGEAHVRGERRLLRVVSDERVEILRHHILQARAITRWRAHLLDVLQQLACAAWRRGLRLRVERARSA
jgi:hypothetical protein